ncbi:hypothetical protein G8C15_06865 [Enterococcus casseliflavus]|nr:hypothetical protein [Enterococcus casseliflavus]
MNCKIDWDNIDDNEIKKILDAYSDKGKDQLDLAVSNYAKKLILETDNVHFESEDLKEITGDIVKQSANILDKNNYKLKKFKYQKQFKYLVRFLSTIVTIILAIITFVWKPDKDIHLTVYFVFVFLTLVLEFVSITFLEDL